MTMTVEGVSQVSGTGGAGTPHAQSISKGGELRQKVVAAAEKELGGELKCMHCGATNHSVNDC